MRSRVDTEAPRCIVCGQRFNSWGDLGPHERRCADEADAYADFQRRQQIDDRLTEKEAANAAD